MAALDNIATTADDVLGTIKNWAKRPFTVDMHAGGWFLFLGLVAVITIAWGVILKDLRGDM